MAPTDNLSVVDPDVPTTVGTGPIVPEIWLEESDVVKDWSVVLGSTRATFVEADDSDDGSVEIALDEMPTTGLVDDEAGGFEVEIGGGVWVELAKELVCESEVVYEVASPPPRTVVSDTLDVVYEVASPPPRTVVVD